MSDVNRTLTSLLLSHTICRHFWQIVIIEVSYILERIFIFLETQLITHLVISFLISNVLADFGFVAAYCIYICVPAPQPACQRTILCTRHGPGAVEPVCAGPYPPRQRPAEHQICVFHGGVDAAAGFLRRLYHPCRAGAGSTARQQKPHFYPAGKRYRSRLGRMEPREHLARPPAASA